MTPFKQCVRRIHAASEQAEPASIRDVIAALKDLEASYVSTSDQVLALETVFQFFKSYCRDETRGDFMRWVSTTIDRHQDNLIAKSA